MSGTHYQSKPNMKVQAFVQRMVQIMRLLPMVATGLILTPHSSLDSSTPVAQAQHHHLLLRGQERLPLHIVHPYAFVALAVVHHHLTNSQLFKYTRNAAPILTAFAELSSLDLQAIC